MIDVFFLCCFSWSLMRVDSILSARTGTGPRLPYRWALALAKLSAHTCEGIMRKSSTPTICFRVEQTCWWVEPCAIRLNLFLHTEKDCGSSALIWEAHRQFCQSEISWMHKRSSPRVATSSVLYTGVWVHLAVTYCVVCLYCVSCIYNNMWQRSLSRDIGLVQCDLVDRSP